MKKSSNERYENFQLLKEDLEAVLKKELPKHTDHRDELMAQMRRKFEIAIIPIAFLFIALCVFQFFANSFNQIEYQEEWKKVYAVAEEKLEAKDLTAAEVSFEKALIVAKKSRSHSMIALTLKDLHDVEMKLGKEDEAAMHQAKQNVSTETITGFFVNIAWILILIGVGIFIFFALLFGPNGPLNTHYKKTGKALTLSDIFSKMKKD